MLTASRADDNATTKKDKQYRKYQAGVERVLSIFETTLQEWADYISFLNRLLKVGLVPLANEDLVAAYATSEEVHQAHFFSPNRHYKLAARRPRSPAKPLSRSVCPSV
jgi:hypothetical protein